jgi:hypothetical protein
MDTDDLSKETYQAVIIAAEKYNHNLTLQFGLLSYECKDDDDYLVKANKLINAWKEDIADSINDIFFDVKKPDPTEFITVLNGIQNKIEKVFKIPFKKRNFEF